MNLVHRVANAHPVAFTAVLAASVSALALRAAFVSVPVYLLDKALGTDPARLAPQL